MEDATLLRNYVETGSDQAFEQLVSRHFDLVFCSALRVVGGNAHLAQDVAQHVFTDLARKAGRLPQGLFLGGWLYRHTCFTAANAVRTERRRENRERQAAEMTNDSSDSEAVWRQLAPILDEAMGDLKTADRDAIMLRFFDRQRFQAVGDALGTSEEGARKRVDRALEKMRSFFVARGLSVSTMVLANAMETHASGAAPAGLSSIVAASALAGAAKGGGAGLFLLNLTTMTKTQIAAVALLAGLAATIMIESRTNAGLRDENRALHDQAAQLDGLRAENERLRAEHVPAAPELSQNQVRELVRLRAEVGRLRDQIATAQKAETQDAATTQKEGMVVQASPPPEVADIMYDFTVTAPSFFQIYAKLAKEKLIANIPSDALVQVKTPRALTRTEALKFLQDALLEQAQITITRSADGTLLATPNDPQNGERVTQIYVPDGEVDPAFAPPPGSDAPLPPGARQIPALPNPPQ